MASRPEPTSLTTREGMARALGIEGMSVEQANQANRQWLEALRNTGDVRVELALANSIWTLQGFPFHASFLGTEAAAVTAAGVGIVCAGCGPKYPVVSLTRPFLFAIQDNATQTVLFLGQITDPS